MTTNKELLDRLAKAKSKVEGWGGTFSLTAGDATEVVEALGGLVRENEALRRFAEAHRMTIDGSMECYLDAVYHLRDDPTTERAGLTDLAWALLQSGNVSRGDWDGFVKHWLAAALKEAP